MSIFLPRTDKLMLAFALRRQKSKSIARIDLQSGHSLASQSCITYFGVYNMIRMTLLGIASLYSHALHTWRGALLVRKSSLSFITAILSNHSIVS